MCFPQFTRSFSSLLFLLEIKHHEHPPPRLAFQFCRTEIVNNYLCNGLPFLSPIQSGNDNQRLRVYLLWWPLLDVSCRGQEVECESQHRGNHIAQSSSIRIPREYQECLWLLYFLRCGNGNSQRHLWNITTNTERHNECIVLLIFTRKRFITISIKVSTRTPKTTLAGRRYTRLALEAKLMSSRCLPSTVLT